MQPEQDQMQRSTQPRALLIHTMHATFHPQQASWSSSAQQSDRVPLTAGPAQRVQ